jgi:hypothetical protein
MDEVILNGTKSRLDVTVELQAFGLVILILTLTPFRFGGAVLAHNALNQGGKRQ